MSHGFEQPVRYDVMICGGGLAGLSLARQLNMRMPELAVLVIDKMARPLPAACHKVGESTIEAGATYFSRVLALKDYLAKHQLPKLGLRFFWGDGSWPIERRCEYGISRFAKHASVQLDRGTFETALREFAVETGATLWEGISVEDIVLSEAEEPHRVICRDPASNQERIVQTRWVIDASGRRQLLKRKLGLAQEFGRKHSASWWRLAGRVDISDVAAPDAKAWHDRVPGRIASSPRTT
jgi:flavin-dependent dehydrogenase